MFLTEKLNERNREKEYKSVIGGNLKESTYLRSKEEYIIGF